MMFDRAQFCTRAMCDAQIHCIISFNGRVDMERMSRAVRLTLDAEPVLGCRFVKRWWRPYWERRDDLDSIKLCEFTEKADIEQEVKQFLTTPIDPCKDPLVQVQILRSVTDTLCIKVNHVVADAGR